MNRFCTFSVVLFFVLFSDLFSQDSLNLQLVGQLRTRGTSQYSNCWGYNAPNGKEYAIVGTGLGTQIVDITTDTLKEVAFIQGPSSSWREMKVYQKYAYVVTEGTGAGLQIIDLDSLKLVNTINSTHVPSGHTISIEGKYLYISGSRYKNRGIVVLDLTDPVHPMYTGEYQNQYVHDCVIKNDTIYAAAIYGIGLDIIDATNKSDIKRVTLINYPFAGTHNADLTQDEKYVITTDEINSDPGQNGNVVRVWDKSNINNVKLVATYVAKPKTIAHNIHIKGNYGYVAHYTEGVRIIDLANPEIPVEVASFDTYPGSANTTIGNWGVFPYFNSTKIIATDMSGGLFVFKFPGQLSPIPVSRGVITVIDSLSNLPISGVLVEQIGTTQSSVTDASGKVNIGSTSDAVTIKLSKSTYNSGYTSRTVKVPLPFNATDIVLKMKSLPIGGISLTVKSKAAENIPGAKVQILNTPESGFTDGSGMYSVPSLAAGITYRAIITKFGYAVDSVDIAVSPDHTAAANVLLTNNARDNFMFDLGWSVGSAADSGTAGRWQRTIPAPIIIIGDTIQPPFGHGGVNDKCYGTGLTNILTDNVEGRTSLVSPVFSMEGMSHPTILFWAFTNTRATIPDDTLYVEISNDNGISWTIVDVITGKHEQWQQYMVTVKSFTTPTANMKIRFAARDGGIPSVYEAAIDDVEFGDNINLSAPVTKLPFPKIFSVYQNYPNPFNPETTIRYDISEKGFVTLKMYDMLGREVNTLIEREIEAGTYGVTFNGDKYSSGVYVYVLRSGGFADMKKMTLMK